MKKTCFLVSFAAFALFLAPLRRCSADMTPPPVEDAVDVGFPVGEELVYKIYWGFIPVGKTRIVTRWVKEEGRTLLAIKYRTRSNRVIATVYPVDDVIESVIDPETFRPVRFTKNLKEGRHRYHEVTTFDYDRLVATWTSILKEKTLEYAIDEDTRDLVSFMYFMRSSTFVSGEKKTFRVMADEKIYDLLVDVKDVERVRLRHFGKVRCIKLEPKAKFQGLFVRKGKMRLWVSNDDRSICTKMKARVPVASINVVLSEVHGPGDDSWIRLTKKKRKDNKETTDPEVERALRELDEEPATPPAPKPVSGPG